MSTQLQGRGGNADQARKTILVVDDEEGIRLTLVRALERAGYECRSAPNADAALDALRVAPADLVLSDVSMPGPTGVWLLERITEDVPGAAVVMVTGVDDTLLAERCLELGAYGYIIKPFEHNEIIVNVANALRRKALEEENEAHRRHLEDLVADRTADLQQVLHRLEASSSALRRAYEETVQRLANAAERHDPTTGIHLVRMSTYAATLAAKAGIEPEQVEMIRLASPMHDIGKLGIPDTVLRNPGKLSAEEMERMRQHPEIGFDILSGSESELLRLGGVIALTHHEKFDGTGYPHGLSGRAIPIEGRIVAIADVFDALTSERPYKAAFPVEQAIEILVGERGRHFDPDLLDLFVDRVLDTLIVL